MFSGIVSGSNLVMKSLRKSGILEPPDDADASVASSWFILWSLISCVILLRTSTPSCLVLAVVVFMMLPLGPTVEICWTFSDMWRGFL